MRTDKIIDETLVAFKQGGLLQKSGRERGPAYRTILRWAKEGLKGKRNPDGTLITLEYCYIGGRLFTSVEAFQRWLTKLNTP